MANSNPQEEEQGAHEPRSAQKPSFAKRAAEAVTLAVSLVIVGGLAVYMLLQVRNPPSDFVELRVQVLWAQAQRKGQSTVVPVELENAGQAALRWAQVHATFTEGGKEQERDLEFQYLAGGSKRRAFLVFGAELDDLRRFANLKAEPVAYAVE